jgi:hypothetical protein
MGDDQLTKFDGDRRSTLTLGITALVFWSVASLAAILAAIFLLLHH